MFVDLRSGREEFCQIIGVVEGCSIGDQADERLRVGAAEPLLCRSEVGAALEQVAGTERDDQVGCFAGRQAWPQSVTQSVAPSPSLLR